MGAGIVSLEVNPAPATSVICTLVSLAPGFFFAQISRMAARLPGPGAIYISQTLRFLAPVKIGELADRDRERLAAGGAVQAADLVGDQREGNGDARKIEGIDKDREAVALSVDMRSMLGQECRWKTLLMIFHSPSTLSSVNMSV